MFKNSKLLYNLFLTIGIVIGTGIFFKNQSIIAAAHGNTRYVIIGWTVGGIISLCSALSFAHLAFYTKKTNNNFGEYTRFAYNEKFSKFITYTFTFVYYPTYSFVIALFSTKYFLSMVGYLPSDLTSISVEQTLVLLMLSLVITFLIVTLNIYAESIAIKFQVSTTVIKLLPFVILIVIAISTFFMNNPNAYWKKEGGQYLNIEDNSSYKATKGLDSFGIIFWIIPSTKFAYDGYLTVSANKKNAGPKVLKAALGIGMLIVVAVYILATIAVLKEGTNSMPDAIVSYFGGDPNNLSNSFRALKDVVLGIIVISGLGSLNGFTTMWKHSIGQILIDYKKKESNKNYWLLFAITFSIAILPWVILTLAFINQHAGLTIFDSVSDIIILISMTLQASILFKIFIMAIKKKIKLTWFIWIAIVITVVGVGITVGYKVIDHIIIDKINSGSEKWFGNIQNYWYILIVFGTIGLFAGSYWSGKRIIKSIK